MKGNLLQAYRLGIERGLWLSQGACARCIGVAESTFRCHVRDEGDESKIAETQRKLDAALAEKPDTEGIPPLKVLYLRGMALELWATIADAQKVLDINRSSLGKYFAMAGIEACASNREQEFYRELERKLRSKISAAERKGKEKPRETNGKGATAPASMTPTGGDTSLQLAQAVQTVVMLIADRVAEVLSQKNTATQPPPSETPSTAVPSVASDWLEEVFAGRAELRGQSLPGVRFVLTAPPFVRLLKGMTGEERTDTKDLARAIRLAVTELRRRLTLSAQTADDAQRASDLAVFGRELDELVIAITQSGDADICASAEMRQRQREEMDQIRETLHKPKNSRNQ